MKMLQEKIKNDDLRDTYWTRVYISSNDESQKTKLLICVSHEYIFSLFNTTELDEAKINQWFEGVIKKWELQEETIFNKEINFDIYANTLEGRERGLKFLKENVL
ncbi:hypothetical protein M0Q50_00090 [bacterium]|jgi:hypothetical protein|nr:hypothetical protein [bacterium]